MNTALVTNYRASRAKFPIAARFALQWARVSLTRFGGNPVDWDDMTGTVTVDGITVTAEIEADGWDDDLTVGTFTDRWSVDAIQNPAWRPSDSNVLRYYVPTESVDSIRRSLHLAGYAKHDAWVSAMSSVRAQAMQDREPESYQIVVRAENERGGYLAGDTVGGFVVSANGSYADNREYLQTSAADLIESTLIEARQDRARQEKAAADAKRLGPLIHLNVAQLAVLDLHEAIDADVSWFLGKTREDGRTEVIGVSEDVVWLLSIDKNGDYTIDHATLGYWTPGTGAVSA